MNGAADHLIRIAIVVCVLLVLGMTYGVALKSILSGMSS